MIKGVVRESANEKDILEYEDFLDELRFQISESYEVEDKFNEFLESNPGIEMTREKFEKQMFKSYIETLENNYPIDIMGDIYYYCSIKQ